VRRGGDGTEQSGERRFEVRVSTSLRVLPPAAPAAEPCVRVINHTVYFNGDCERCRPQ